MTLAEMRALVNSRIQQKSVVSNTKTEVTQVDGSDTKSNGHATGLDSSPIVPDAGSVNPHKLPQPIALLSKGVEQTIEAPIALPKETKKRPVPMNDEEAKSSPKKMTAEKRVHASQDAITIAEIVSSSLGRCMPLSLTPIECSG
jgi:hypothetical protein